MSERVDGMSKQARLLVWVQTRFLRSSRVVRLGDHLVLTDFKLFAFGEVDSVWGVSVRALGCVEQLLK